MATGDSSDITTRIKSYLPRGWFGDSTPILDAVLAGISQILSFIYTLYAYAVLQTRIATATDAWLDLIAYDFFGSTIKRSTGQSDDAFRSVIVAALFAEKATRAGMIKMLTTMTGRTPVIFEPNRPADTGAMNAPTSAGYCGVARMGSMAVPYTCMITAYRPKATGGSAGGAFADAPKISAMATPLATSYANSMGYAQQYVTDADIYAAIASCKMEGTIAWVHISS